MTVPTRPLYTPNLQPGEAERIAIIDLNALEHNTRVLKDMIGERKLIAVVKADAYGHGAYPRGTVSTRSRCRYFWALCM